MKSRLINEYILLHKNKQERTPVSYTHLSIGEIVINTPAPAIAHAIYRATGVWHRELPITPEKILMSMPEDVYKRQH